MTLASYIRNSQRKLEAVYPPNEAANIVSLLLQDRLHMQVWEMALHYDMEVLEQQLDEDMNELVEGKPIQYVLGYTEFYGHRFKVTPDVLIPRPDTETLIEKVLSRCSKDKPMKILDLCTGSGCLAWTLAQALPLAEVKAVDISDKALQVARNQDFPSSKVTFLKGDALDADFLKSLGQFDVVICNPPYIMESEKAEMHRNVLEHEPALALYVPDDSPLVFYEALAHSAQNLLAPGALLAVECNEKLSGEVAHLFENARLGDVRVFKSLAGRPLFVEATRK